MKGWLGNVVFFQVVIYTTKQTWQATGSLLQTGMAKWTMSSMTVLQKIQTCFFMECVIRDTWKNFYDHKVLVYLYRLRPGLWAFLKKSEH